MSQDVYARIRANPKYQHLVKTRNGYGKIMTIIMFIVYYGYISLIAFDKELLATPLSSSGVTTPALFAAARVCRSSAKVYRRSFPALLTDPATPT